MNEDHKENQAINATINWLKDVVIGLGLCPFAARPLKEEKIRFICCEEEHPKFILQQLDYELDYLERHPKEIETTVFILTEALVDFQEYLDMLMLAEQILVQKKLEGIFQIASFHPDYQFGGEAADDVSHYTNRSPYPIFHLLREDSLTVAIDSHPDTAQIPERNIALLQEMGIQKIKQLWSAFDRQ